MRPSVPGQPRFGPVFVLCCALLLPFAVGAPRLRAQAVAPVQPPPPPEFDPANEPSVRAVAQVLPAVVNISTERVVRRQVRDPFEEFFEKFFDAPVNRHPREYRQKIQSLGSGFLVDPDGSIMTNEHVVERAADLKIKVTFSDGSSFPARYVSGDAQTDLALIKIESRDGKRFPYIDLARLSPNLLGQTVLALGNPVGYNSSVSRGILSAKEREITVENTTYQHLLQTDAAINPGNSGGPLIDLAGRLVGINSVKMSFTPQGTPTQGLGFALPAELVAAKFNVFRAAGRNRPPAPAEGGSDNGAPGDDNATPAPRPRENFKGGDDSAANTAPATRRLFGLTLIPGAEAPREMTRALAAAGINAGVLIRRIELASPADQAGLKPGMFIVKVGTYGASSPARIESLLKDVAPGTAVDFVVFTGASASNRSPLSTVTLIAAR